MDCLLVIPARFASRRFPGKLMASLGGKPLIDHVVRRCLRVEGVELTVVATDDQRIARAARAAGAEVVMTNDEYHSGTDRVAAVAAEHDAGVVVNVQADEVLLEPAGLSEALARFRASEHELGTLCTPLTEVADLWNPDVVKVVVDRSGRALYFSRAPLPLPRACVRRADSPAGGSEVDPLNPLAHGREERLARAAPTRSVSGWRFDGAPRLPGPYRVHLGVYLYRSPALMRWAELPPSPLEQAEGLEQLRVIEAGETMQTYSLRDAVPGVNSPEDLERIRALYAERLAEA